MTTYLLSFEVAGNLLAVDIDRVRAVVDVAHVRRLPDTPAFLLGLVDSPLGVVPLVDFARKFRLSGAEAAPGTRAVVVEACVDGRSTLMGVAASGACKVFEVAAQDLAPAPALGSGIRAEYLRGVASLNAQGVPIVDLARALSATETEALEGLRRDIASRPTGVDEATTAPLRPRADQDGEGRRAGEELLVFSVSGERLALPLGELREVAQHRSPAPVPGAADWIHGAINVRGEVVPLLDVARRLGLNPTRPAARSFNLIAEIALGDGHAPVALFVDAVHDVTSHRPADVGDASMGLRLPQQYVRGLVRAREEFVPILDVAALFGSHRGRT